MVGSSGSRSPTASKSHGDRAYFWSFIGGREESREGERDKREREHTQHPHMGERERCRKLERKSDAKRQKAMERDE